MCETPVIVFQEPMNLNGYDRSRPASEQSLNIPLAFQDAMSIREEVFVKEQGVPLLMEADQDDARSYHWIAYDRLPGHSQLTPAGTLRMVPFPHDPHPLPDSSWDFDTEGEGSHIERKPIPYVIDRATTFHDGKEPYIKLGRWAVRAEFRGRGIAGLLVRTALDWARVNVNCLNLPSIASRHLSHPLDASQATWNGLVCVHAQESVERAWARLGFLTDEGMGKWTEAGIPHVGMFARLELSS